MSNAPKFDLPGAIAPGDRSHNQFPNVTAVKIFEQVQNYHEAPPRDPPP